MALNVVPRAVPARSSTPAVRERHVSFPGMEIGGLPLHPLVVHAAVTLVPLAAVAACALALVPSWRWLSRWVALLASIGAVVVVYVARMSGKALLRDRPFLNQPGTRTAALIATHQHRAAILMVLVVLLAAAVIVAFLVLPAKSGLVSGQLDHGGTDTRLISTVTVVLLLLLGLAVLVSVFLVGEAGARAVWG